MIGFNGKYLLKAAQGNMRITAMSLGSQDLLGTLTWLNRAARATLLAAFGQEDGRKVINATNDYLHRMAITDKDKAVALQGYIHEDPMLVCSLGLEPQGMNMPIRWLEAPNRNAWIDTGWIPRGNDFELETIIKLRNTSGWTQVYATTWTDVGIDHMYDGANTYFHTAGSNNTGGFTAYQVGYPYRIVHNYTTISRGIVGEAAEQVITGALQKFTTPRTLKLFHGDNHGNFNGYMQMFIRRQGGMDIQWFVPYISEGEHGMRDLLTGTFYPNANTSGAFTISYTLPDGTPWTPANN